jgi:hypothetical protein
VTHVWDGSGTPLLQGMPTQAEALASDALLGVNSIETDGT